MHPYKRSSRVSDLVREEVADIIMNRLRNTHIGFVTVTGAKVSDDLRHATVYLSVLEDKKRAGTLKILNSSSAFIRSELARRIKTKFIPSLTFQIDESVEYGRKIDRILDEIGSERNSSDEDEDLF